VEERRFQTQDEESLAMGPSLQQVLPYTLYALSQFRGKIEKVWILGGGSHFSEKSLDEELKVVKRLL
jgi:hypothetical protein